MSQASQDRDIGRKHIEHLDFRSAPAGPPTGGSTSGSTLQLIDIQRLKEQELSEVKRTCVFPLTCRVNHYSRPFRHLFYFVARLLTEIGDSCLLSDEMSTPNQFSKRRPQQRTCSSSVSLPSFCSTNRPKQHQETHYFRERRMGVSPGRCALAPRRRLDCIEERHRGSTFRAHLPRGRKPRSLSDPVDDG